VNVKVSEVGARSLNTQPDTSVGLQSSSSRFVMFVLVNVVAESALPAGNSAEVVIFIKNISQPLYLLQYPSVM
jgi:hypothetical protein